VLVRGSPPVPEPAVQEVIDVAPAAAPHVLKRETLFFQDEKEGEARKRAVATWYRLMIGMPQEGLGSLVARAYLDQGRDAAVQCVLDCFARKATSTLVMRAGAVTLYEKWARASGRVPFPIEEHIAYLYVQHLRSVRAPSSRATSFTSSVAFMMHVCGMDSFKAVTTSVRVGGAAWAASEGRRDVRQAPPLTSLHVRRIQDLIQDKKAQVQERVMAGFLAFCIEARLRISDAQHVVKEPSLDLGSDGQGYVETQMGTLKTTRAKARRNRVLKVAGHTRDHADRNWAVTWLELRKSQGMDVATNRCLQPQPLRGGGWGRAPMSTVDIGNFMRAILEAPIVEDVRVSAHSCKVTYLSWAAKFGMRRSTRKLLGYHASGKDSSMLDYSRDAVAGPLRSLEKMLSEVWEGRFEPDATRSGRFTKKTAARSEEPSPLEARGRKRPPPREWGVSLVLQTVKKMVHQVQIDANPNKAKCGKKIHKLYAPYIRGNAAQDKRVSFCDACFRL